MENYGEANLVKFQQQTEYGRQTAVAALEGFFRNYYRDSHPPSDEQIASIHKQLIADGAFNRHGGWVALKRKPAKAKELRSWQPASDRAKLQRLKGLGMIVEQVRIATERVVGGARFCAAARKTKYVYGLPNRPIEGEDAGTPPGVDAAFVKNRASDYNLIRPGGAALTPTIDWLDSKSYAVADTVCGGVLTTDKSVNGVFENCRRTLAYAREVMYSDLVHLTVHSFTIEDTIMRFWYHYHVQSVVTRQFDVNKDPLLLIKFIITMSYTPLQKLGFDSTVFRVRDIDGRLQYLFGFYHHNRPSGSDTVYQTTRALNESEAEYPGYDHKCMRVFEVHRITKFAHDPQERQLAERPAVLRDFWQRDEHTPRERVKQRAIIDVLKREGVWAEMKGKFMGIPEDGGVHYPPTIGVHVRPDPLARRPKGLRHYRGVYTQLCIDLYQVDNPALFFRALSQVVRILQYFKRVGYLHGDVSMGNFLLHHVTGRLPISLGGISRKDIKDWNVIVSDLEFSRTYPCKDEPYPFGTRLFMSTEWRQSCYKHTDGTDDASKPLNDPTHKRNFVYNFYHDLECVLWMAMYYVLERVPQKRLSSVPDIRAVMIEIESRDNLSQYFYDDASPLRFGLIENEAGSIGLRHRLRNFYYDDTHGPLLDVLSLARDMRAAYRAVENGWTAADTIKLDDGRTVFAPARFADAIYDKLADAFRGVSEYYLDHPDVFIITPPRPPKPPFSGIPKLRIPVRPEWELAQPKYGDLNEGPCECDECVREAQPVPPVATRTRNALKRRANETAEERQAKRVRKAAQVIVDSENDPSKANAKNTDVRRSRRIAEMGKHR